MNLQEAKDAVGLLVEAGVDVKFNNNLFYKSQSGPYRILKFDNNSNLKGSDEENFETLDEGVSRWLELSKDKLVK